ncbi:MAG TPA: adenylate/guanylate cyclase domain-containing protein [Candidatus Acidoferrum sp.]|nr:adenylate/guanylate cyclase domain-containing protein [Candidatus Acidoferrum sp.]
MNLSFQHFRTRLLVLLLIPLLAVLIAIYLLVARANSGNAQELIRHDLAIGAANFNAAVTDRNDNLAIAGDALSSDYAFRQVLTADRATLLSAMNNLLGRLVTADFIALASARDGKLLADTRRPDLKDAVTEWQSLIDRAKALDTKGEYPEASDVLVIDGKPYHVTVMPMLAPDLVDWLAIGFEIGGPFTASFKQTVAADVSVLFRDRDGRWQVSGSTLPAPLPAQLAASFTGSGNSSLVRLGDDDYVTLTNPLSKTAEVQVVLQRSLAEQLAPFKALQQRLIAIFALSMLVLVAVLVLLARNVTQPLQLLTLGVRRIAAGDYGQQVQIAHRDEFGELATAFNAMAGGLAEKERVRALLGKVVSPAIANELLGKQPELGGEEREVTIMFTDIHGFTTLSEGRPPQQVLALLNEYFTMLGAVIEQHHGVVDKYIGDAVMALFGAPLADADAARHAMEAALAVAPALARLNAAMTARGLPRLTMRIGIHNDRVVVGNMGSQERLNYTAIGDGVNLASRLENLCKPYGVDIIVSDSIRAAAPQFLYLPLDLVRVKGKQTPVRIHTVLPADVTDQVALRAVHRFEHFLQRWQRGDWQAAAAALDDYEAGAAHLPALRNGIVALYRQRLQRFMQSPPHDWDGVFSFDEK